MRDIILFSHKTNAYNTLLMYMHSYCNFKDVFVENAVSQCPCVCVIVFSCFQCRNLKQWWYCFFQAPTSSKKNHVLSEMRIGHYSETLKTKEAVSVFFIIGYVMQKIYYREKMVLLQYILVSIALLTLNLILLVLKLNWWLLVLIF